MCAESINKIYLLLAGVASVYVIVERCTAAAPVMCHISAVKTSGRHELSANIARIVAELFS